MRTILYWFVRLVVRPALTNGLPVAVQRRWSGAMGLFLIGARNVRRSLDEIAGVRVLWLNPKNAEAGRTILYLHGGGYVLGGPGSHAKMAARLARAARARVCLPEYRLAPEHPAPAALSDALAVYSALIREGQDPARLTLAGDSAGGGLALATVIAARDFNLPPPAALALLSPWVDLSLSGPTTATLADHDPLVKFSWAAWCADAYRGAADPRDPMLSPLFADLRGLPPILIQVGSVEMLLSDAERLAAAARAAGNAVTLHRYDRLWHVFQLHAGMLPAADAALTEIANFARGPTAGLFRAA